MKKLKTLMCRMLLGCAIVCMAAACSSKEDNYLNALPAQSTVVLKMNIPQMIQKSNLLNNALAQGLLMQVEMGIPAELKDKYAELKKNPAACGLDIQKPMAMAVEMKSMDKMQFVATLAVNDADKLNELLKAVAASDNELSLSDAGNGITRVALKSQPDFQCAFNSSRLVIASGTDAQAAVAQTAENSMMAHKDFAEFAENQNDYACFVDYGRALQLAASSLPSATLPPTVALLKDCALFADVNFDKGKMTGKVKIYASDELVAYQKQFFKKPKGRFLRLLPADCYLAISGAGTNLEKQLEAMGEEWNQQMNEALKSYGLSTDLLTAIDGDVLMGVYANDDAMPIPNMVLAVECKDRTLFEKTAQLLNVAIAPNEKMFEVAGLNYCVVYVDGALIAAPKALYEECLSNGSIGKVKNSLKDAPQADVFEMAGMYANFQSIAESTLWKQFGYERKIIAAQKALGQFDKATVQMKALDEVYGELTFTDSEKNALEQLINIGMGVALGGIR